MSIIGFLGYTIIFTYLLGLRPADAAKVVITGDLGKDPISYYHRTIALADSIKSAAQKDIKIQADSLNVEKRKINAEKTELLAIKDEISRLTQLRENLQDNSVYNLAKIYNDMDPNQLANVMIDLDDSVIVSILPKMKNQKASRILEMLPPDRAAKISSMLLGKG